MADEAPGRLKFVCLRDEKILRLHMYTGGGTLMSSLESDDPADLKALTAAWLRTRGLPFDEAELEAAIGRAGEDAPS
jgi:hypothetical protein